jgi:DNA modification methylase
MDLFKPPPAPDGRGWRNLCLLGACEDLLGRIPRGAVRLWFCDPPFNIGFRGYGGEHDDRMPADAYLAWTERWLAGVRDATADDGSIYVAIGDEFVAETNLAMKRLGLHFRNWIVWHYTFGENQRGKFGRCKTHILYFAKHPERRVFNADAIRVESARQRNGDKRADPRGKVPDDVWVESRVCGTFHEKLEGGPGCQMPRAILDRVILASSDAGDVVGDCFAGNFTTALRAVALGRDFVTIEKSQAFFDAGAKRVYDALAARAAAAGGAALPSGAAAAPTV